MVIKVLAIGLSLAVAAPASGVAGSGAEALGDRLFPAIDKVHDSSCLDGRTTMPDAITIRAVATRTLPWFSLDSIAQRIASTQVNGHKAGPKLVVTPVTGVRDHIIDVTTD